MCAAFGSAKRVLRKPDFDDYGYAFASERHADLANALGISAFGVGTGCASFEEGELPEGLSADDVAHTA